MDAIEAFINEIGICILVEACINEIWSLFSCFYNFNKPYNILDKRDILDFTLRFQISIMFVILEMLPLILYFLTKKLIKYKGSSKLSSFRI